MKALIQLVFVISIDFNGILSTTIYTIDRVQRFNPSNFVIRYSAVRCSARLPAAKAARLIIKKACHFGVVSYMYIASPFPET